MRRADVMWLEVDSERITASPTLTLQDKEREREGGIGINQR
jgi:hypothetical protein